MRIISKFHDYYDIALSQGYDDDLMYVRSTSELAPFKSATKFEIYVGMDYGNQLETEWFVIGFCGKVHLGFKVNKSYSIYQPKSKQEICYSIEDFRRYTEKLNDKEINEALNKTAPRHRFSRRSTNTYESIEKSFNNFKEHTTANSEIFRNLKTPCFAIVAFDRKPHIIINPSLKDYGFQKVYDPYQAYQELSMYIGGVLGRGEKETLCRKDFPDEPLIRDSKGFDKWSFKKRPKE